MPSSPPSEAGSATKLDKIKNLHVLSVGVHLERLGEEVSWITTILSTEKRTLGGFGLKDREATSGRLADMILKLVVANEACEEHKALIAELKTELAAMVAENPSIAARMSVAEERETVISQNTHKAAYTEAHDALYPHVPINVPPEVTSIGV